MSKTKQGAKTDRAPQTDTASEAKSITVISPASAKGANGGTVGKAIATAIVSIVQGFTVADVGLRTMIDGAMAIVKGSQGADLEPELILVRVGKLFDVARSAIVDGLSPEAKGEFDGYGPQVNPQPSKAGRKAHGLPMKDRLNARDSRVLARRAGTMSADVRTAHDAIEASYNFASKVGRIAQAMLTVPAFADVVSKYNEKLPNGLDFALSPSALLDAAKDVLKPAKDATEEGEEGGTEEGATVADTLDAIIARAVAQLRAIGRDDAADAILATVAGLATPVAATVTEEGAAE
jgi:hypothetical protein